jgi:pyridoxal phosphate enzyme (YggS family)
VAVIVQIAENLARVRDRVHSVERRAGRAPGSTEIVAVSKKMPVEAIVAAHHAGQRVFGENYVQELVRKAADLRDLADLKFHFIGHLQTNKAKDVVRAGALVETVDSSRVAEALDRHVEGAPLEVFIQVNVAGEAHKGGCSEAELPSLLSSVGACPGLRVRGLMVIPPACDDPEGSRIWFRRARTLADGARLADCSMGMSHDFEIAIEEGATLVRVGTAIFGPRPL